MLMPYLSKADMKALDDLKASYGGAKKISKTIDGKRDYKHRKEALTKKGFGRHLAEAEGFAKRFPKASKFQGKITRKGVATTQVSGWQGCKVTHNCMKRLAEKGIVLIPKEMIAVMALTDDYVYSGDLMATLAMCENIMGARFCNTSLVGTPLPAQRFDHIRKATGLTIATVDAGNGLKAVPLKNMGTAFGNLTGVEVANDNHLVYIDSITRTAVETGADFFLNPSWSTIVAACYYGRDIPDITFKISMLLSTQNTVMFRMLMQIIKTYLRKDHTSPICEINIGNAVSPAKFMECADILKSSTIKGISLTAHIRINPDLGVADFNWFDNALQVLDRGYDMTIKYESDGQCRPMDTMACYFISKQECDEKSETIGDVLYHKVLRCDQDAKAIMELGHKARFADISEK